MTQPPKNHAASVRTKLLNRARADGDDFQRLLVRFAIERLLFRVSSSPYRDAFILKGATLFAEWLGKPHRATKDLDLLGHGAPDIDHFTRVFQEIVAVPCVEDGIVFDPAGIQGETIREEADYPGVRVHVPGNLAGAVFRVQVDIGIGDAAVPPPRHITVTPLLDLPAPHLRAYARETVVAEKLEALVVRGITTSRMKDLYDLDLLRRTYAFDDTLTDAVRATFSRRGTSIPAEVPIGLSDTFAEDPGKLAQWDAFLRKATAGEKPPLGTVITALRAWLVPVLQSAAR